MSSLPEPVIQAMYFDASHWANGPASDDPIYQVPDGASKAIPGSVLKVEIDADIDRYSLPPATALTRFIYQSENLMGKPVPASAFILWPYSPKSQADGYAVIAWAHGTDKATVNHAPSNYTSLSQHPLAPFQFAAQGYVVVGPDYAGIGVHKHASEEPIVHEYLASLAHANDVVYAVKAAQKNFPELSQDFVIVGHSQGGGAAWATAQRQVDKPIPGYLGGVAISPVTIILDQPEPMLTIRGVAVISGIASIFPEFRAEHILFQPGLPGLAIGIAYLLGEDTGAGILKPNWRENEHV